MIIQFLIASLLLAIAAFSIRNVRVSHALVFVQILLLIGLLMYEFPRMHVQEGVYFEVDHVGMLFNCVLCILATTSAISYVTYAAKRGEAPRSVSLHTAGYILFIGAIVGASLACHFGVLWIFFEATTLSAAILVYHDRDNLALEATWKFIFVCSIAVAMALAGILFLALAAHYIIDPTAAGQVQMDFGMRQVSDMAASMNPVWLKASFLFALAGFSAKMSLLPFFNVDIDAKDVAPSPIGALFSSALLNVGFIAVFRFYKAFSGTSIFPWMNNVLLITGVISIFLAAIYLLKIHNYKRMLAYSSMEHAGMVVIALAMGGQGYFAAFLHLVVHSFAKASMFYQIGQVFRVYGSKHTDDTGGYMYLNPAGALTILLGLLAITAIPPSGLFITEFMTFSMLFAKGFWWVAIGLMVLLSFILYSLMKNFLHLLFIRPEGFDPLRYGKVSPWESLTQHLLLGFVLYLGFVQPQVLTDFINAAIAGLPE